MPEDAQKEEPMENQLFHIVADVDTDVFDNDSITLYMLLVTSL